MSKGNQNQINEDIRAKEVRVIDTDGSQLGVMTPSQALQIASEKKLDLVNVAPNANPPVCRIMDYGKYRYEMQKKAKDAKKRQKVTQVKEVRLSTFIEKHDLMVKANNASKFLKGGDKVKVSIRFRGRERGHTAAGEQVMRDFAETVSEYGQIEKKPLLEGRNMTMVLAPKNNSQKEK
ncbi:MAG: translation initiation factor IF-3 [Eubacteriales bacterium]|nr:translation initiation factor IF-3 [Eubacteriales bacterium]